MADVLRLIDAAIDQAAEQMHCGWCKGPLTGTEEALEFCNRACQERWHDSPLRSYGEMPDKPLGLPLPPFIPEDLDLRYAETVPPDLPGAYRLLRDWRRLLYPGLTGSTRAMVERTVANLQAFIAIEEAKQPRQAEPPVLDLPVRAALEHLSIIVCNDYDDDIWPVVSNDEPVADTTYTCWWNPVSWRLR